MNSTIENSTFYPTCLPAAMIGSDIIESDAKAWLPEANGASYEVLVSPHLQYLERWVRSKVRSKEDADDVVQQTLLLAFRHIGQFRFEASFRTWLSRIAINEIRGRMRRPDVARTLFADPSTLESLNVRDPRTSVLLGLEREEQHCRLHAAIGKLPDCYRAVIEMRDVKGFSINETAKALGLSKPAIKSRHHRARSRLLKILGKRHPGSMEMLPN